MARSAYPRNAQSLLFVTALSLILAACDGDDGVRGPPGPRGLGEATALDIAVTRVTINSAPIVEFRVTDQDGIPVIGVDVSNLRFTLAKLDTSVNPSAWVSYVNREEDVQDCIDDPPPGADCGPGAAQMPPTTAIQATRDQNGTLVDRQNGTYSYTFATDVTNVTTPVAVTYDANAAHRLGIQTRGGLPTVNATYNFVPATGATTGIPRRDIVKTETCNSCHNKLEAHDGREEAAYCVTCHNPGSTDANSGNTVDFKVMVHKLHRGEDLPSVVNSGEYAIWGFGNTKHDYSDVVFPQDIRACQTCHVPDPDNAPQAGNWESNPNIEACGACHDNIKFNVAGPLPGVTPGDDPDGHPGGAVTDNSLCIDCHRPGGLVPVADSHTILERVAATRFKWNVVSISNTAPTNSPVIVFSVTDPTNNNAPWDLNDPAFTTGSGISRLAILVGWDSRDKANNTLQLEFDNAGSGAAAPGQPISINALLPAAGGIAVAGPDPGTYQVTSPTAIPALAGTELTGVVAIEGHPAGQDADGNYTLRVPVASTFQTFAIAGTAQQRRQVVSTEKCNACHFALSMHGANRNLTDDQMCVVCHNPTGTDANARPSALRNAGPRQGDPAVLTLDGKREESIDMKTMIHAIHAGAQSGHGVREDALVVWGFPGFGQPFGGGCNAMNNFPCQHDYGEVRYPGILSDCQACHLAGTYELDGTWELPTQNGILANSIDTHPTATDQATLDAQIADQTNDLNISPTAAVCAACHDSTVAQAHMTLNGAVFGTPGDAANPPATQADINSNVEACAVCHGPGRGADVAQVHEID